jgi:hypothetical protein
MTPDRRPNDSLETALRALASTIELPPPDYAERVLRQLTDPTTTSPRGARRRPTGRSTAMRRVVTAAAALLIAVVVTVAVPASRHAVASWFGFAGIDIRTAPTESTPPSVPVSPAPLAAGDRVTLNQAQHAASNRLRLPAKLSPPDQVFVRRDDAAVIVTLAYRSASTLQPTPDTGFALIVTEIFDAGDPVLTKLLHNGALATSVQVGGRSGVFIAGPQDVIMLDHSRTTHGEPVAHEVSARASANTLVWADGATTYRLEGDFTQRVALELAETVR